jgi:hypothetical protein
MSFRAAIAWLAILCFAIANGALRQGFLIPRLGERAGHIISTLMLSGAVFMATWIMLPWIRPGSVRAAWSVGVLWISLTLAFEFLAGHYVFRISWEKLFADYNLAAGRIWILVLACTLLSPVVVYRLRDAA